MLLWLWERAAPPLATGTSSHNSQNTTRKQEMTSGTLFYRLQASQLRLSIRCPRRHSGPQVWHDPLVVHEEHRIVGCQRISSGPPTKPLAAPATAMANTACHSIIIAPNSWGAGRDVRTYDPDPKPSNRVLSSPPKNMRMNSSAFGMNQAQSIDTRQR